MASIHPPRFDPGFGVYVHWPFCLSKCPYCDFNSHVRRSAIDEPRFPTAPRRPPAALSNRYFSAAAPPRS
jgi:oxygen-independent coproporphyrinogen-3 oxidase